MSELQGPMQVAIREASEEGRSLLPARTQFEQVLPHLGETPRTSIEIASRAGMERGKVAVILADGYKLGKCSRVYYRDPNYPNVKFAYTRKVEGAAIPSKQPLSEGMPSVRLIQVCEVTLKGQIFTLSLEEAGSLVKQLQQVRKGM